MTRSFLLALLAFTSIVLRAQDRCLSHTITQRWLQEHGQPTDLRAALGHVPHTAQRGGLVHVPVAVHVVWNTSAENVTTAAIMDILDQMNQDYQAQNSDLGNVRNTFASVQGNAGIEFCLASVDPNGNATTGITRTQTTDTWFDPDNETNDMKSAPKGISPWDPTHYLNIWICDITSGAAGNLVTVGYAYLPVGGMVGSNIDGLVIDYSYGTQPGDRTATHEIGHYMGLDHPWADGGCGSDDGMDDVPVTDGPTFSCANTSLMHCGQLTQYENFMDYADCSLMFTDDQAAYMNDVLSGVRSGLLSSGGCGTTTPVEGCVPTAAVGTSDGDYVDGVVLGSINNVGSGAGPAYTNFSSQYSTTLAQGGEYTVYITTGTYEPDNFAVWIDYNADGAYTEAEKIGEFVNTDASETWMITFDVPNNATTGNTHMRVRGVYTGETDPITACDDYDYGETEDYGITIVESVGPAPCIPTSVTGTGDGDFVDGVVLQDINNTGSGSIGGPTYQDYTGQQTVLTRGGNYTLSVTSGAYEQDIVSAWIDFNDDGDFTSGELVGETVTSSTYETTDFPFTVPSLAVLDLVRMRVRCVFPDTDSGEPEASDPCVDFSWGETEDYGVVIQTSTGILSHTDGKLFLGQTSDAITASWPATSAEQHLMVLDAAGRLLVNVQPVGNTFRIPTTGFAAGTYQVVVANGEGRMVGRFFTGAAE